MCSAVHFRCPNASVCTQNKIMTSVKLAVPVWYETVGGHRQKEEHRRVIW